MAWGFRRHVAATLLGVVAVVTGALTGAAPTGAGSPAATLTGAGSPAATPGAQPPDQDPFYRPPSPLPAGEPGTILRSRPVTVHAAPGGVLALPVRAWQVLYLSTSAMGEANAVSGTVLVPRTPWPGGPRPLVTYAVGTHGLGDQCAPSYRLATGTQGETSLLGQALARGWAVAVTDYEGLGTPGTHTYVVGVSEGHAVLDAARAARRLEEAGLGAGGPVAIWGYSQGGQAAVWAGELQPSYAPELAVVGVAAGGVPADLDTVARHLDGGPAAGLVLAGAVGYGAAYPELALESILNDAGRAAASRVAASCVADIVADHAFHRMARYSTIPDPLGEPSFAARLAENRAGARPPAAPVLLYHGTLDELIPLPVGEQLVADYRRLGVRVRWLPLPLLGHVPAAVAGAPVVVSWLGARFAGGAVTVPR